MRHDNLKKELELISLLTQNHSLTIDDLCERIGLSRRSFYYYIEFFRNAGFDVEKEGDIYSISYTSKFFDEIREKLQFTNDDALLIRNLIEGCEVKNNRMKNLLTKLEGFYDFGAIEDESAVQRVTRTMQRVNEAMRKRRLLRIVGYSSPSSHSVKDRIVEPFLFMNNNNDVRCYEIESGKNKTFRLSRMDSVEVLDEPWSHKEEHRKVYTDLFLFSGEEHMIITMHLGQLARNLMLEEYPNSAPCMADMGGGKWLFRTEVCSYLGIGRFVLGLLDDITVLGDEGFIEYLKAKTKKYHEMLSVAQKEEKADDNLVQ